MSPQINELELDSWNLEEMARHGVTGDEVQQVVDGETVFLRNRRRRSTTLLMIGPTLGGRFLTVPLAPAGRFGVWRPATAWTSTGGEIQRYRAAGGA